MGISVILTYKGAWPKTLKKCMECINNQTVKADEVILIDGNYVGKNETDSISIGIRESKGNTIFFTNVDCYVPPNWIEKHLEWHNRGYRMVSGLRIDVDRIGSSRNPLTNGSPLFEQRPNIGVSGSNLSLDRSILSEICWPKLRTYWDMEISLQVPRFVIDTSVVVIHDHPYKNLKDSYYKAFRYSVAAIRMIRIVREGLSFNGIRVPLQPLFLEVIQVNPVKVYKMYGYGSLPRFLFNRLIFRLGQVVGIIYALV